ncbi:hypothetical protein M758_UG308600 [Ceratodon purpureus]|nr:hypothetical protein M758_UG308600 [Ceratodon purpureus]
MAPILLHIHRQFHCSPLRQRYQLPLLLMLLLLLLSSVFWWKYSLHSFSQITRLPLSLNQKSVPVLGSRKINANTLIYHFGSHSNHTIENLLTSNCCS